MDKKTQHILEITFIILFITGVILVILGAVYNITALWISSCFITMTAGTFLAVIGKPKKKNK